MTHLEEEGNAGLLIAHSLTFIPERQYVYNVLLHEFLGLAYFIVVGP